MVELKSKLKWIYAFMFTGYLSTYTMYAIKYWTCRMSIRVDFWLSVTRLCKKELFWYIIVVELPRYVILWDESVKVNGHEIDEFQGVWEWYSTWFEIRWQTLVVWVIWYMEWVIPCRSWLVDIYIRSLHVCTQYWRVW